MTLRWLEGFEICGAIDQRLDIAVAGLSRKYDNAIVTETDVIAWGRSGGKCWYCPHGVQHKLRKTFTQNGTWIIGIALYIPETPTITQTFIAIYDTFSPQQLRLSINGDRHLVLNRLGTILETGTTAVSLNEWIYIELKAVIHNSAGSYEVRINGVEEMSATDVDTSESGNPYANIIEIWAFGDIQEVYFDDIYICDGDGSANNDFLFTSGQDCQIEAIFPSAVGNSSAWTPSAGDNYAAVDESPMDDDTTYVDTSTDDAKDTHAFGNLSRINDAIYGLQIEITSRETDATSYTLVPVTRSGGADYDGSEVLISGEAYHTDCSVVEEDPDTSAAWDVAGVNAAEFGYKQTT